MSVPVRRLSFQTHKQSNKLALRLSLVCDKCGVAALRAVRNTLGILDFTSFLQ